MWKECRTHGVVEADISYLLLSQKPPLLSRQDACLAYHWRYMVAAPSLSSYPFTIQTVAYTEHTPSVMVSLGSTVPLSLCQALSRYGPLSRVEAGASLAPCLAVCREQSWRRAQRKQASAQTVRACEETAGNTLCPLSALSLFLTYKAADFLGWQ